MRYHITIFTVFKKFDILRNILKNVFSLTPLGKTCHRQELTL